MHDCIGFNFHRERYIHHLQRQGLEDFLNCPSNVPDSQSWCVLHF
nr:MAG TPA: hypothetical protein [Caudoviricetes sp.]